MEDNFGDGWNGGYLVAEVNGINTKYSVSASQATKAEQSFEVPVGGSLTWSYTGGSYDEENDFTIISPNGTKYGPFNGDGLPFCFF
jgi:hypothetical protein